MLTVFGAGAQSLEHVRTVLTVRNLPRIIYIINRSMDKAIALKKQLLNEINGSKTEIVCILLSDFEANQNEKYAAVISEADVICTCTASEQPLFDGNLLKDGVHINAVGAYKPNMNELDANVIEQSFVFLDSRHAFDAGDLCNVFGDADVDQLNGVKWREIGEYICNHRMEGKQFGKPIDEKYENEKTLFKSVGVAAQDLHSAYFIYHNALAAGVGTNVVL